MDTLSDCLFYLGAYLYPTAGWIHVVSVYFISVHTCIHSWMDTRCHCLFYLYLYIRRPPNFYRNSSCILWTRRTHFWCPLRLRWSRSDDLIGMARARAQSKLAKYFVTIAFFYELYSKNHCDLYVPYYPPTFSCRLGFFASSYLHLHRLRCRACVSWTPRVRPQHRPLHTAGTLRRDTCPQMTFPMPALSPPAMLPGAFLVGRA